MSAQQVIVKAYYNDLVENQPEIRRFAVSILFIFLLRSKYKSIYIYIIYRSMLHQPMMFIKHWKQQLLN
jgi:hypothetical protein